MRAQKEGFGAESATLSARPDCDWAFAAPTRGRLVAFVFGSRFEFEFASELEANRSIGSTRVERNWSEEPEACTLG